MDTEVLRWFQLVADGVTVTEVAETYAVSQPGVSRALSRLEAEVGTPLLHRSGRVLRLTHAGMVFKRHVDALVNDLDDGLYAIEQLLDPKGGLVNLAFPLSLGTWFVPEQIRAFSDLRPRVQFMLSRTPVGEPGLASRILERQAVDLEVTTHLIAGPGVAWRRVTVEPLLLAVPLDHPLAARERAGLSEVWREPFVIRRPPSGMREQVLSLCHAAGFEPKIAYEVDDQPTVRGFVGAGLGVAVVPALGRSGPMVLGPVRLIPLTDAGAQRDIGLAWLTDRRLLPAAAAFRDFVIDHATAR